MPLLQNLIEVNFMRIRNFVAGLTSIFVIGSSFAVNASDFTVNLNGESAEFTNSPFLMEDYIMMPIRETAEKYSYKVIWHEEDNSIELLKVDSVCFLKVDSDEAILNGKTLKLPRPVTVVADCSYAPVAFFKILESDVNIAWDYDKSTLSITSSAIRSKEGLFEQPNTADASPATLLNVDGTFEDKTSQGWKPRVSGTTIEITDKLAHKGKCSLHTYGTGTDPFLVSLDIKSILEANGPGKYCLTFWAKSGKGILSSRVLLAKINNDNSQEYGKNFNIDSQWKKYSVEVDVPWTQLSSAMSIMRFDGSAADVAEGVYLDDIVLLKK